MKIRCTFRLHQWPDVWTKYEEHALIDVDGLWFEAFEMMCLRNCGARKTLRGPLRYSKALGGGISSVNYL